MVNDAEQMVLMVNDQYRMHFILLHYLLNLSNLCVGQHAFRRTRHDVLHGVVHKGGLPFLHRPADVTVCDEADDFLVVVKRYW